MGNADDFLEHYGIKGMRWGVRRSDDQIGRAKAKGESESTGSSAKAASSGAPKSSKPKESGGDAMRQALGEFYANKSPAELKAEGQRKLNAQANQSFPHSGKKGSPSPKSASAEMGDNPSVDDIKSGRLSKKQKVALGVGGAVAIGVLAYYGNQKLNPNSSRRVGQRTQDRELASLFGDAMAARPKNNQAGDFYAGLTSGKAMDRPGFTIPKSTVFQRLSNHPETGEGYSNGAYATFLTNDKKIYGSSMEFGYKQYTVKFNPSDDVRVPSTKTVLETLAAVGRNGDPSKPLTPKEAVSTYHALSGGGWKDDISVGLINSLKKQGYSALVDDMDAGYLGDLPMVFFGEPSNIKADPRTVVERVADRKQKVQPSRRYA